MKEGLEAVIAARTVISHAEAESGRSTSVSLDPR